jgi:hypothetical protein
MRSISDEHGESRLRVPADHLVSLQPLRVILTSWNHEYIVQMIHTLAQYGPHKHECN